MMAKWGVNKIWFGLILITCFHQTRGRQLNEEVYFLKTHFDFKDILESSEIVSYNYQFLVSGNDSIAINSVIPSCGCIIPDWDRNYLQPGDTGVFRIGFNPYNRPGRFVKQVAVTFTNGHSEQLEIAGNVLTEESLKKEFQYVSELLRYDKRRIFFTNISPVSEQKFKVRFFNDSEKTIKLDSALIVSNNRYELQASNWTISSGSFISMNGTFVAPDKPDYYEFGIQVFPEGADLIALDIAANVTGKSAESEGEGDESDISFDKSVINLGKINKGNIVKSGIQISNNGNGQLIISNIKSNCSCITTTVNNLELDSGEVYQLGFWLDTTNLDGVQQKTLHFYSNSENATLQQVMIKVNVVK